ncbi:MAG: hypothetical protein R2862_02060, partial [Thermoanaerobaculia bacterium]
MSVTNRLQAAIAVLNLLCLGLFAAHLVAHRAPAERGRFAELDVERLNVVGAEGRPVLILSNRPRLPGPIFGGREYPKELAEGRSLLSGMIFLNEEGDEVGGLLYNGFKKGEGESDYGALEHLSFDQWKQNQVLALQYNDHGTSRRAGLTIWDRPTDRPLEEEFARREKMLAASGEALAALEREQAEARAAGAHGAQRLFVGSRDRVAQIELNDAAGRVRARLYVGADD